MDLISTRSFDAAEKLDCPAIFHSLQRFPTAVALGTNPLLFVEINGEVVLHEGAALWAISRVAGRAHRSIYNDLRVLGRLHDFHQVAWRGQPLPDEDRSVFVWSFLDARYHGTMGPEHLRGLTWNPVAYSTVRGEFRSLARYFDFVDRRRRWREEGFESPTFPTIFNSTLRRDAGARKRDFFSHLAQSRARWATLFGSSERMPDLGVREATGGTSTFSLDRTMDLEEARYLIQRETNPVYKALWILGAFGGPRISESLHMWQCDVLPAPSGAHLAGRPQSSICAVIAHPAESRYLGDFTQAGSTRLQYLYRYYGLSPRHHLVGYRRVGWKNPLETDTKLRLSEVFWCDLDQAAAFAEVYAEVRHFHSKNRTSERHPYLWVNLNRSKGFAEPLAYAKVQEAFSRACRRVGLEPSRNGRRIHGLRHLYKQQLTTLGLPREHIQVAMRHRVPDSQDDYGRTSKEIHSILNEKLAWGAVP